MLPRPVRAVDGVLKTRDALLLEICAQVLFVKNANLASNSKSPVVMVLIHQPFVTQCLEYSVDRRSWNLQLVGKLRRADAVTPVEQCQNIQTTT
jgi:hypothetical protein